MSINKIPVIPLSSGNGIPLVGMGTVADPLNPDLKQAVIKAIELGCRHFDTASLYQTEIPLGEAISEALKLGFIKSREELFVTSKLWLSEAHPGLVVPALQKSLRNLGFEYLDLYLVHFPASAKPGKYEVYMNKEELMPIDLGGVWKDMEECYKLGLAKSIGVSNFSCKKLQTLLDLGTIPPAVNQVEMNPCWQQKKLREFCKEKGIHISAQFPLGVDRTTLGSNRVTECDTLRKIAQAKGKTVAQVCLRWGYERGVSMIVKSFDEESNKENIGIYDWKLCDEDYQKIEEIPQTKGFLYTHITGDDCPYKTLDDLWDGEI